MGITGYALIGAAIGLVIGLAQMIFMRRDVAKVSAYPDGQSRLFKTYLKIMPFIGPVLYTAGGAYLGTTLYGGQ